MAKHRPDISNQLKKRLRQEAGGKCTNPGCPNLRTHLHHIREWAVYQTHDGSHMIAVCPTCHDAVHHGALGIDDETLYAWKQIPRDGSVTRDHIYVEPGPCPRILLGTFVVTTPQDVVVFKFGISQELSFRTCQADLVLLHLQVHDTEGSHVIEICDNYVTHKARSDVEYKSVPGWIHVAAPANPLFVPGWALAQMRAVTPSFAGNGQVIVASVRVLEPGLVRVQGVWMSSESGVIITEESASFLQKGSKVPLTILGAGKDSVISWEGPITTALFDPRRSGPAQPGLAPDGRVPAAPARR